MADDSAPATADPAFDVGAYVKAVAPAVGLTLNDEEAEAVAAQLARVAHFAAIVTAALDDPKTAPAPVFAPRNPARDGGER